MSSTYEHGVIRGTSKSRFKTKRLHLHTMQKKKGEKKLPYDSADFFFARVRRHFFLVF